MYKLSRREAEILHLIAQGFTSKEVAKLTGLDYRSVQTYVLRIRKKLVAKNVVHAIYKYFIKSM